MTPQLQNLIVYLIGAAALLTILLRLYRARRRTDLCAGCQLKEHCSGKRHEVKKSGKRPAEQKGKSPGMLPEPLPDAPQNIPQNISQDTQPNIPPRAMPVVSTDTPPDMSTEKFINNHPDGFPDECGKRLQKRFEKSGKRPENYKKPERNTENSSNQPEISGKL